MTLLEIDSPYKHSYNAESNIQEKGRTLLSRFMPTDILDYRMVKLIFDKEIDRFEPITVLEVEEEISTFDITPLELSSGCNDKDTTSTLQTTTDFTWEATNNVKQIICYKLAKIVHRIKWVLKYEGELMDVAFLWVDPGKWKPVLDYIVEANILSAQQIRIGHIDQEIPLDNASHKDFIRLE